MVDLYESCGRSVGRLCDGSKWVVRTNSGCLEMLCNHVCLCTILEGINQR